MSVGVTIRARRGTAALWTSVNPTLTLGEIAYETDTGKHKFGDGSTAWNSLGYATPLVDLSLSTGTLPATNGGTGLSSFSSSNRLLYTTSTTAIGETDASAQYETLYDNGSGPEFRPFNEVMKLGFGASMSTTGQMLFFKSGSTVRTTAASAPTSGDVMTWDGFDAGWAAPVFPSGGLSDDDFRVFNDGDPTALVGFDCSLISGGTTRLLTVPDAPGTIALKALTVQADGTTPLSANWDAGNYNIRTLTLQSHVATGTAPLTIASTTKVTNLNADLLDDQSGAYYLAAGNLTGQVAPANGGTGLGTIGSALEVLRVNAAGTALEFAAPSSGAADLSNVVNGPLPLADGGTGAATASAARAALGVAIGSDVQAYSADLATYAASPLTSGELAELGNIGATTISATQWGYLGALGAAPWTSANDGPGSGLDADTLDGVEASALLLADLSNATADLAIVDGGTGASTAAGARTALGLEIGTDVQAQDAELSAIAGLTSAADSAPYFTGSGTAALATLTTFGRSLIDDADAATAQATLGLEPGTDIQAYSADLATLAGLGSALQVARTNAAGTAIEWATLATGSGDVVSTGVSGGQTVSGGTADSESLTLQSNASTPTTTGFVEVNSYLKAVQYARALDALLVSSSGSDSGGTVLKGVSGVLFTAASYGGSESARFSGASIKIGAGLGTSGQNLVAAPAHFERGGSAEIDGDHLGITFTPSNYTPSTAPAEAANVDDLAAHLAGIDDAIGSAGGGSVIASTNDGRLSLHSSDPIGEASAAGTLYLHRYAGDQIALYDGSSAWSYLTIAATPLSIALSGATATRPSDVFAYDDSGTVALEFAAWTNATTRATVLTRQDGVLVKTGATTRRYLGTVYVNGSNQATDAILNRGLWNESNAVRYVDASFDDTDTWTDSGNGTWSAINSGNANWTHYAMRGRARFPFSARIQLHASNNYCIAIGRDTTTTPDRTLTQMAFQNNSVAYMIGAEFAEAAVEGWSYLQGLESSATASAGTGIGDNGAGTFAINSGMVTEGER